VRDVLLVNVTLLSGPHRGVKDILIQDGIPRLWNSAGPLPQSLRKIDCRSLTLFTSPIDNHVHFREPGPVAYKEGWDTGSLSALRGGITGVIEVQNSPPYCDSASALKAKDELVKAKSLVNYGFWGNILPDNLDRLREMAHLCCGFKLFMGHSTGRLGVDDRNIWNRAAEIAAETKLPIAVHAEDSGLLEAAAAEHGHHCTDTNLLRPPEAEIAAVREAIELSRRTGAHIHVFHVSCAGSVELLRAAKDAGVNVSIAVCPHHLLLTADDANKSPAQMKVYPPLRPASDRDALLHALRAGAIDVLQSDHAPHLADEKLSVYQQSPGGFPGVEHLLQLGTTLVHRGALSAEFLERMLCHGPRHISGIPLPITQEGLPTEFALVDMDFPNAISASNSASRCGWTPYEGMAVRGRVVWLFLSGSLFQPDDPMMIKPVVSNLAFVQKASGDGC